MFDGRTEEVRAILLTGLVEHTKLDPGSGRSGKDCLRCQVWMKRQVPIVKPCGCE